MASNGMTTPPTRRGPEPEFAGERRPAALDEGLVDDAAVRHVVEHPAEPNAIAAACTTTPPAMIQAITEYVLRMMSSLFVGAGRGIRSPPLSSRRDAPERGRPDGAWRGAAHHSGGSPRRNGATPAAIAARGGSWDCGPQAGLLLTLARSGWRRWSTSSSSGGSSRRCRSRARVAAARRPADFRVRHVAAHGVVGAIGAFIVLGVDRDGASARPTRPLFSATSMIS